MSLRQRVVAVFILVGGTALAAGLAVGAFTVNATSDNESAASRASVAQTLSSAHVGPHTTHGLVFSPR